MTSFKKKDIAIKENTPLVTSAISPHQRACLAEKASETVSYLIGRLMELFPSAKDHSRDDLAIFSKEILFACMVMVENGPLLAGKGPYGRLFEILLDELCSSLYESIFDETPTGTRFEYFACLFHNEYKSYREDFILKTKAVVEDRKGALAFIFNNDVLEHLSASGHFEDNPLDDFSIHIDGLLRTVRLMISKALLS